MAATCCRQRGFPMPAGRSFHNGERFITGDITLAPCRSLVADQCFDQQGKDDKRSCCYPSLIGSHGQEESPRRPRNNLLPVFPTGFDVAAVFFFFFFFFSVLLKSIDRLMFSSRER